MGDVGIYTIPPVTELIERCIQGKNVMLTGAGGESALSCVDKYQNTNRLYLCCLNNLNFLYNIEKEIKAYNADLKVIAILGSPTHTLRV